MWSISIKCRELQRRPVRRSEVAAAAAVPLPHLSFHRRRNRAARSAPLRRRSGGAGRLRLRIGLALRRFPPGRRIRRSRRRVARLLRGRSGAGGDRRVLHRHGAIRFRGGLIVRCRSGPGFALRRPAFGARPAWRPARVVAVERLLHDAADKLPHGHAGVHVRQQPPQVLQSLLAVGVDDRLQLVAPVAERAHAVGRRRQFGVQVGQHAADLACALAGRLLDELPPSCRIEHQWWRRRSGSPLRPRRPPPIVRPRSLRRG